MKKLFFLSIMLTISIVLFGQATPGKIVRIADRTTAMGVNLPIGTQIYCASDSTMWEVKAAMASTLTLTTGHAVLSLKKTDVRNSATRGTVNYAVAIDSTKATYQALSIGAATTSYAGVMTAADKTKLDGISAGAGTMQTDNFEVATAGSGKFETLSAVPKDSTGIRASLNGVELKLTTQFYMGTLSVKKITFKVPVYQYDTVVVTYTK